MSEKTYIKGKDAALEESIDAMLKKLKALNIHIEEASWLNSVPNVYSVHKWVNWCLQTGQLDNETTRFYLCLQSLLEIQMDDQRQLEGYSKLHQAKQNNWPAELVEQS